MDGPIYWPSGIISTVIRPQERNGLCAIPQPAWKKDHQKWSDQPNGVSAQKPVPEMQERQMTYRKIQEIPLQDRIKRR